MADAPLRVLCIGSPFGADAIAFEVMRLLEGRLDRENVSVTAHDRPGVDLMRLMRGARGVVLVDAVKTGAVPGSVVRLEWPKIKTALARHTSTHGFGLADAMVLAETLGELPRQLVLVGMEMGGEDAALPLANAVLAEVAAQSSQLTR